MPPMPVTLNDLQGRSSVAVLYKCNSSTICVAFFKFQIIMYGTQSLSDSWASCPKLLFPFPSLERTN